MLASEYAKKLLEQVAIHGDHPVVVTQAGYYADGAYADLYVPDLPETVRAYVGMGKWEEQGPFYILGHSYQSY
jgi:hypothetical protein